MSVCLCVRTNLSSTIATTIFVQYSSNLVHGSTNVKTKTKFGGQVPRVNDPLLYPKTAYSVGSQILYVFETHGIGQTPSSLERYLVKLIVAHVVFTLQTHAVIFLLIIMYPYTWNIFLSSAVSSISQQAMMRLKQDLSSIHNLFLAESVTVVMFML